MAKQSTGLIARPVRMVIAGVEGIGKSTLASKAPAPVFLDAENGSARLDVRRVTDFTDWQDLCVSAADLISDPSCGTIVLDTVDAAEEMVRKHVLKAAKAETIEAVSGGFGKGWTMMAEQYASFLRVMDSAIDAGKHVILIAHVRDKSITLPDMLGSYSRWELKLSKQIASLTKEWADVMLFCRYKTQTVKDGSGAKAVGKPERVMQTQHDARWDAKNRYGLGDPLPMQWEGPIADLFRTAAPAPNASAAFMRLRQLRKERPKDMASIAKAMGCAKFSDINEEKAAAIIAEIERLEEEEEAL